MPDLTKQKQEQPLRGTGRELLTLKMNTERISTAKIRNVQSGETRPSYWRIPHREEQQQWIWEKKKKKKKREEIQSHILYLKIKKTTRCNYIHD